MTTSSDPHRAPVLTAQSNAPVLAGNFLAIASMVTWASAFPAAGHLLQTWAPLPLILARLAVAIVVLVPVWMLLDGRRAVLHANWRRGLVLGGIGFGFGAWLLLVAQSLTDPVTVALIASCAPLMGTLLEAVGGRRRVTLRFGLGLGASVLGGAVATNALSPAEIGPGAVCAVLSVGFFTWGSDRAIRGLPDLTPIGRTTVTLSGALLVVAVLYLGAVLLGLDAAVAVAPARGDVAPLLIYALLSMAISQAFWIASVERLGVALASFHINIAPFYVMLILLALGQGWNWFQALGAAVVAGGVIIAQSRPRARGRPAPG